ncbi:MAG: phospholipase, partial [Rhodoferax sp.]|nr:phospholipase [Rhodoferax sp.]
MRSMQVFAGPRARARLLEAGLRADDVRAVPAAAGGPKGLVLIPLDRLLFGHWLHRAGGIVHLLGASIGAWRMASACLGDADVALARLAEDYITQTYEHEPGRPPQASHVSAVFGAKLAEHFGGREHEILRHPRWRLHVFTSHGRHLLARQGRWRTPLGYAGAFFGNALHRRALGGWLERVVFSDPRDALPLPLADLRGRQVALSTANLQPAVLASCSIPFWLDAVHDIPGGPRGAYWDGGITDYHLHLDYAAIADGIVLYPHFQPRIVPGWLDKPWTRRHRASRWLDNLVVLAPHPDWVRTLPGGKLPDRGDFE